MERVKGFTLLEITVALLLTGILVVMAYGIIGSFHQLAIRYQGSDGDLERSRELQLALIMDSDRTDALVRTPKGFAFTSTGRWIGYDLHGDALIRTVEHERDTFHLPFISLRLYWQNNEVSRDGDPADRIQATLTLEGDTLPLLVEHHYDAVTRRAFDR